MPESPSPTSADSTGPAKSIRIERDDALCLTRITLDRPTRGNSLSAAMVLELADAIATCHSDGTRVLCIDADGANFCTGFDLSGLDDEDDDSLLARFVRIELLLQAIHRAPFLTVAVAQGRAWGAGADLFVACSQRWAQADASFAFPGAGFGLILGTRRLAAKVGAPRAEAWIAGAARIGSEEALVSGLATRCLERSDAENPAVAAMAAVRTFSEATQAVDGATLAAIREAAGAAGQAAGLDADGEDLARLVRSAARPGLRERIAAYRARSSRRPVDA